MHSLASELIIKSTFSQSHCSGNIFIKIFNVMNYFPLEDQLKIKGCEQLMSIAHFQ